MRHVTVNVHLFHILETVMKLVAQCANSFVFSPHFGLGDAKGLAHPDDLVRWQRTRAQAALMTAAVDLRLNTHTRFASHVQRADPLGAVYLVRRDRQQVDLELLCINKDFSRGLDGITMENDALFAADLADLCNRLDDADLVVDHHH